MRLRPRRVLLGIVLATGTIGVSVFSYMQYQSILEHQRALDRADADNTALRQQNSELATKLKRYSVVNAGELIALCMEKANADYLRYIKDNSTTTTEGNVTTHMPKSREVLRVADEQLVAERAGCKASLATTD